MSALIGLGSYSTPSTVRDAHTVNQEKEGTRPPASLTENELGRHTGRESGERDYAGCDDPR